jgi:hypothetical protein
MTSFIHALVASPFGHAALPSFRSVIKLTQIRLDDYNTTVSFLDPSLSEGTEITLLLLLMLDSNLMYSEDFLCRKELSSL